MGLKCLSILIVWCKCLDNTTRALTMGFVSALMGLFLLILIIILVLILVILILIVLVLILVLIVIVLILIVLLLILQHLSGIDEILLRIQIIRSENQCFS